MPCKVAFFAVAIGFSIFYALYATRLFQIEVKEWWPVGFWHNFVNFVGSAIGSAAAYYFVAYRLLPIRSFSFRAEDIIPLAIAILGVTGFLPYTLGKLKT
jgi:hypothetical protein